MFSDKKEILERGKKLQKQRVRHTPKEINTQ